MESKSSTNNMITDDFSYPLVRNYPYGRAFKWWVFGAFGCFLGFLTVFNLAVNGFDKEVTYTSDPNTTMSTSHWYNNGFFTWGSNSLKPTCQSLQIPVGYRFITTNLGLQYTVSKICNVGDPSDPRASISYLNNPLENCDIGNINIRLKKSDFTPPDKELKIFHRYSWDDSFASTTARCNISSRDGRFSIEFTVDYKPTTSSFSFMTAPNDMNAPTEHTSRPIFWWGERLINVYFAGLLQVMSGYIPDNATVPPIYAQARIDFSTKNITDMPDRSIHNANLYELNYIFQQSSGTTDTLQGEKYEWMYNNASFALSRPLTEAFMWTKVWRSLILADLGNNETENLLTNETLLRYILDPPDDFNRLPGAPLSLKGDFSSSKWMYQAFPQRNRDPIMMNTAMDFFHNKTGELKTKPASIFAEYICNVPGQKSPVAMALFTLAANLAVFHTAWSLFKFVADRRALKKDTYSNWCVGCIEMHRSHSLDGHETDSGSDARTSAEMAERRPSCACNRRSLRTSDIEERRSMAEHDFSDSLLCPETAAFSISNSTQRLIPV